MNFFDFIAPIYKKINFGAKRTVKKLEALDKFQKTDKVLDLGGGTGRIAKFLISSVQEIVVADASEGMIKECKKQERLHCFLATAESLPFEDNYFDKVIIVDAFHHFKNQEKVCGEIKRVLRPNGSVLIEEFNPKNFIGRLIKVWEKLLCLKSKFHSPEILSGFFRKRQFGNIKILDPGRTIYYLSAKKI